MPKTLSKVLAVNMKKRREELEISQSDLAAKVGVSKGMVQHYEAGRRAPHLNKIPDIAKALGVPVSSLLGLK